MQNFVLRVGTAAAVLMLAACGSSHVETSGPGVATRNARPDRIVVEDFAAQPSVVTLDSGVSARIARAVSSDTADADRREAAAKVVRKVSETLIKELNTTGIATAPSSALPSLAPNYTSLVVSGRMLSIDEGNRTRRNVVGLGVGASKVTAQIGVYLQAPGEAPRLLQTYDAESESGKKPGLVVAGVGAAAGRAATAAAVGVGSDVASETLGATVEDDAARMAKEVAAALKALFVDQGWIAPAR
ncbi:MAG TPA: DUF4410 domain-containing protein [Stellaceae bacterium]|jgi:hypothetical protein